MHTKADSETVTSAAPIRSEAPRAYVVGGFELLPAEFAEYTNLRSRGLDGGEALALISPYLFRRDR